MLGTLCERYGPVFSAISNMACYFCKRNILFLATEGPTHNRLSSCAVPVAAPSSFQINMITFVANDAGVLFPVIPSNQAIQILIALPLFCPFRIDWTSCHVAACSLALHCPNIVDCITSNFFSGCSIYFQNDCLICVLSCPCIPGTSRQATPPLGPSRTSGSWWKLAKWSLMN